MRFVSPLCLIFALAALIGGFTMVAVPEPEPNMELHAARVRGDDAYRDLLEADLARRRTGRTVLIATLFVTSGALTVAAFLALGGDRKAN